MLQLVPLHPGQLTSDITAVTSTLASPLLAPLRRVSLRGLCVALPKGLSDVIAASPVTVGWALFT